MLFKAFELAEEPSACRERVKVVNPECGHQIEIRCYKEQEMLRKGIMERSLPPVDVVEEGKSNHLFANPVFRTKCPQDVVLKRRYVVLTFFLC